MPKQRGLALRLSSKSTGCVFATPPLNPQNHTHNSVKTCSLLLTCGTTVAFSASPALLKKFFSGLRAPLDADVSGLAACCCPCCSSLTALTRKPSARPRQACRTARGACCRTPGVARRVSTAALPGKVAIFRRFCRISYYRRQSRRASRRAQTAQMIAAPRVACCAGWIMSAYEGPRSPNTSCAVEGWNRAR